MRERRETHQVVPYTWNFDRAEVRGRKVTVWGEDFPAKRAGDQLYIVTPDGEMHSTIEGAFFAYRLRPCACVSMIDTLATCQAFLTVVNLGILDHDRQFVVERLFDGSEAFCDLYANWMEQLGLAQHEEVMIEGRPSNVLTNEGRGVLEMFRESEIFQPKAIPYAEASVPVIEAPEPVLALPSPMKPFEEAIRHHAPTTLLPREIRKQLRAKRMKVARPIRAQHLV